MTSKLLSALSRDIGRIFDDTEKFDVEIEVGEKPNLACFQAHSLILKSRSETLKNELAECEKVDGKFSLRKAKMDPKIFEAVLKYIYNATIELEDQEVPRLLDTLVVADELLLHELADHIEEYLLAHKNEWLQKNFTSIWRRSQTTEFNTKLKSCCQQVICANPNCLFKSDDFLELDSDLLVSILKLDNLKMDEVEIWGHVVRWGIAQDPTVPKARECWTRDDYLKLEKILRPSIEHIRWFHISPIDFFDKVWPYKDTLPPTLLDDLIRNHFKPGTTLTSIVLPPRMVTFDSTIIKIEHVARIASWIDRKEDADFYTCDNTPYDFKLLVRGSRDGFDADTFHTKCDDQGATVVVLKIRDSGEVIGGYNPIRWVTGNGHLITEESFIYSFGLTGKIEAGKISRPQRTNCAIPLNDRNHGPCFGDKDLWMTNNFNEDRNCWCQQDDYANSITSTYKFCVDEYEVFQVVPKQLVKGAESVAQETNEGNEENGENGETGENGENAENAENGENGGNGGNGANGANGANGGNSQDNLAQNNASTQNPDTNTDNTDN
ncbi:5448_t:CDS:2 [Paraglomus occultum]|uniref:5448_t:CDS:1 n=1 Tax=Paraglomus occultum TaxID=144539 RepID=A0A9N9G5T7_9GLOM|nr:5448_t:CDS:2 [Paraglomus occultum]